MMKRLNLVLVHRLIVMALAFAGCATSGQPLPRPLACALPTLEQLAIAVATCVANGGELVGCFEFAAPAQLEPYIECTRTVHLQKKCGGACPFDKVTLPSPSRAAENPGRTSRGHQPSIASELAASGESGP